MVGLDHHGVFSSLLNNSMIAINVPSVPQFSPAILSRHIDP